MSFAEVRFFSILFALWKVPVGFIRTRMESAHLPGLSLAIIRDGKLLRATGFGFANLPQQRPIRAETLIKIGSITKLPRLLR